LIEVAQNSTPTLVAIARVGARIQSASAAVYSPRSTVAIQTGAATVDAVNTTVASVVSDTQITVASATGIVAGRSYLLACDEGPERVRVERVSGVSVWLAHETSGQIRAGNALTGLQLSLVLASGTTAERGLDYRVEWSITLITGATATEQTMFHVVAMPLGPVVDVGDVSDLLEAYGANQWRRWRGRAESIAQRANERVRCAIENHDRYPHLYASPTPFREAALLAVQLELAETYRTFPTATSDEQAYLSDLRARFADAHARAVRRLTWYDANDSREPDNEERRPLQSASLRL